MAACGSEMITVIMLESSIVRSRAALVEDSATERRAKDCSIITACSTCVCLSASENPSSGEINDTSSHHGDITMNASIPKTESLLDHYHYCL